MNTRTPLRTLYGLVAWLHVIVGAALAIQGPALPQIRATFGLSLFGVSWLFPAMSLGHLLGVLGSGVPSVTRRRRLMTMFGTVMLTVGFTALGGAPYWGVALAGGLVLGLGFGCLDVVLNAAIGDGIPEPTAQGPCPQRAAHVLLCGHVARTTPVGVGAGTRRHVAAGIPARCPPAGTKPARGVDCLVPGRPRRSVLPGRRPGASSSPTPRCAGWRS